MRNFISKVGFVILAVGVSSADCDNLLIPLVITGFGVLLMFCGMKEEI